MIPSMCSEICCFSRYYIKQIETLILNNKQSSPVIIKWSLGSDTPRTPTLLDGKLAAVCQEDPPSFFRISVVTKALLSECPPVTI